MTAKVTTRSGALEGEEQRGVLVFRGIPYAAAPIGKLRFRPPEGPPSWQGVRSARRFGPSAPQSVAMGRIARRLVGGGPDQSQDCLYLNVWTPATQGRRPVMVWIHGGAFVLGSGSTRLYSGARLARRGDVVVVTLNYRLGALGFLNLREVLASSESPSANLGLRDQIAALEWVRDHIERFGGDPENVTVFGESAGAMSVGTLLGTPRARGLFRRAILQSGAAHNVSSAEEGSAIAEHFLQELGIAQLDMEALRALPVSELMRAQTATSRKMGIVDGSLPFQPSVDGDLLPEPPLDAIAGGLSSDVCVLVGSNRDEWKLFTLGDTGLRRMNEDHLRRRLARTLSGSGSQLAELAYETYQNAGGERRGLSPADRWVAFQSDRIFHYPAACLAETHAASGGRSYTYLFDWAPPLLGKRIGACHGIEIPFVFGTLRDPWLRPLLGSTRTARKLSHRIQEAWLGFARTGHPGHPNLPHWPVYARDRRRTLVLGADCHLRDSLFEEERRFWEQVL
ncbi:MAG: carboxylesterase/lipase family protein [Proteobacteria bacterium]|nr:carboxylesterase/lipase family protein [Pseudomonadota bacterium]MCZ6784865.1 carboxylesterase/lipase family protein [Pseudomonadota bacterium]